MKTIGCISAASPREYLQPYEQWQLDLLPKVLPAAWKEGRGRLGELFFFSKDGLRVMSSALVEADGKRWQHVSLSRAARLPSWEDLRAVKDLFIGRDKMAIQVLPRAADYCNVHPHCLHLWHCLDGDPAPDFRHEGIV